MNQLEMGRGGGREGRKGRHGKGRRGKSEQYGIQEAATGLRAGVPYLRPRTVDEEEWKGGEQFLHSTQLLLSRPFQLSPSRPDSEAASESPGHSVRPWACSHLPSSPKEEASGYRWGAGLCGSGLW